jgi:hypothetical protein
VSFDKWSDEEKWAEANSVANLITGVYVDGPPYKGKRPEPVNTISGLQARLAAHIFQQHAVNIAILTHLGIPFHLQEGAIKIDGA